LSVATIIFPQYPSTGILYQHCNHGSKIALYLLGLHLRC
jgi:hypothetical protein